MAKLKALFANRWFWRVVGAIVGGVLIWFIGPLIAIGSVRPFAWWPVTLFFALLPIVLVGLFWFLGNRRENKKNAALVDALAPAPGATERGAIEEKLGDALKMLRTSRLGARGAYVYQLPWYAIIGPSGAGKTTSLLNSGLAFPTAVAGEYRALRGQPNTPNCDWWFTEEAVLIDTAGRYVTQEAGAEDAEGWRGFLDLLRTHRPLQPLNGIIVAIPAPDFGDAAKMAAHAEHLRARLGEIAKGLGQDLPVYLLVTKADLLPGFREFFARNTDAESAQVFGSTAPGEKGDDAGVIAGFDALVNRMSSDVVARMQQEAELPRRAEIAAFPIQLASLRTPIAALLSALGQSGRFEHPARIRGVYLASGTQTGNPVDRILLSAGVPATAPAHGVGSGRSYFLRRLFSDVIFPEQGLANHNAGAEKRQRRLYQGGIAAAAAALVVALALWSYGYAKNRRLIAGIYQVADAYKATGATAEPSPNADVELAALGVLGKARSDMAEASDFGLGLGQGGRLEGEVRALYGRDLQRRLTPMLATLASGRLAADTANPSALYDDLKSYLILGGRGPLEEGKAVTAWVQAAWAARGGSDAQAQAGDVARHAQALMDYAFKPVAIDAAQVETARGVIRAQPAAVRVYGRLKSEALAGSDAMWSARDNAGPQPAAFFGEDGAFAPGAGVPKLFTRNGYERTFLPALTSGPALLNEERWVVGDVSRQTMGPAEMGALKADLQRLYFNEFLTRWRDYMAAMKPRPATTLPETIQRLQDASGPLSPISPLMRAIAAATDMTPSAAAKQASKLPGMAMVNTLVGGAGNGGEDPRTAAIRSFAALRLFVGKPGAPGPLDAVLTSMGQLADKLNMVAVLPGGGGATAATASLEVKAAVAKLEQSGATMPAPAGPWIQAVAGGASQALGGARMGQVGSAMGANFGTACRETLGRAFPFQAAAASEVAMPDFVKFFGPQGAFANFVQQDLAGYVDTSKPEWAALPNAAEIGITPTSVVAFQAAQNVTRAFFASDPATPRLSYQIEPVALAGAKSVTITIDGQTLKYDGKTPLPATFDWPGAGGASLAFTADTPGEPRAWTGQWAAFRMMKAAAVRSGGSPSTGTGSLTQGGARFDFKIRTFAGANPFAVDPFVKVSCPAAGTTEPKPAAA